MTADRGIGLRPFCACLRGRCKPRWITSATMRATVNADYEKIMARINGRQSARCRSEVASESRENEGSTCTTANADPLGR